MPETIESFDAMSELPIDKSSKTLWGVNIAVDPQFAGQGVAKELIATAISKAKQLGIKEMKGGIRLAGMKQMIDSGMIQNPVDYPITLDKLAKAFISATQRENVQISFSAPQKYWEIDEESLGYASIITIKILEDKMNTVLDRCVAETITLGEEKIEYFAVGPHRGCSHSCKFCGVKSARTCDDNLIELGFLNDGKMTRNYGEIIFDEFRNLADNNASDVLLMNGGNIIREEEMYLPAITEWIPKFIAQSDNFKSMTIEVRADDIILRTNTLLEIQKNLAGKDLVVRLPIEYADEKMLADSNKGISLKTIENATETLRANVIKWDACSMLGGLNLNSSSAIELAERTVRFAFDKGARNVIINAQFVTEDMRSVLDEISVPSLGDIITLLKRLRGVPGKIKVGFDVDEILNPIKFPQGTDAERETLSKFNETQKL